MANIPAVSVVLPMYNAEKYVAESLNCLLAQTFTDFEVIVVNDCSTDGSPAIVESYAKKFDGRLKLSRTEKNTGSGAMPRNKGLTLSRGEYVFCMDTDDLITNTALEELYTLAKEYDADVVYCEKNYRSKDDGTRFDIEIGQKGTPVDKPTLETENPAERVQDILRWRYMAPPWRKFVRRSLIVENEIFFPWCVISEDDIWTYGLVFCAKKFLRVPNIVYTRRLSEGSKIRKKKTPQETVTFWSNPVVLGLTTLEKFMSKHKFFQLNPQYRYAVLEMFIKRKFGNFFDESCRLPPYVVYETIKQEFSDRLGEQNVLISALCAFINTQQKMAAVNQQKFNQFATQAQRRIAELEAQIKIK